MGHQYSHEKILIVFFFFFFYVNEFIFARNFQLSAAVLFSFVHESMSIHLCMFAYFGSKSQV